jgi:hypothetical protein
MNRSRVICIKDVPCEDGYHFVKGRLYVMEYEMLTRQIKVYYDATSSSFVSFRNYLALLDHFKEASRGDIIKDALSNI